MSPLRSNSRPPTFADRSPPTPAPVSPRTYGPRSTEESLDAPSERRESVLDPGLKLLFAVVLVVMVVLLALSALGALAMVWVSLGVVEAW